MSDVFDMFAEIPESLKTDLDNIKPVSSKSSSELESSSNSENPAAVDLVPEPVLDPRGSDVAAVSDAVVELSFGSGGFLTEPDLTALAYAVSDLLAAAGDQQGAIAADRWARYEGSYRRDTKIAEAQARAEQAYRNDLTAIQSSRPTLHRTEQSNLPWRQPGDPTGPSRPLPDEHEP